jgi:hypothetical protein
MDIPVLKPVAVLHPQAIETQNGYGGNKWTWLAVSG